jgi:membrane-associated phospholipid phosphatase
MVLTDVVNVRPGVELMTAAVAVAALAISRKPALFIHDWWFLLLGLVLWNLSGPIAARSPFPHHLDPLLQADRLLFLGHDPVVLVQHALAVPGHLGPLDVLTALAYNLHLPEPFIAGYLLWRLNRLVYLQFAASVLILLVLGFVTFILFPAVPPWMASTWYGRLPHVYNGFGPVLRAHPLPFHGTPIFYVFKLSGDAVAAFPSEHAAFPMLEYLAFSRLAPRASLLLLLWVFWVLFSVVYLGEHWVTDVIAGWLYAVVIFWVVRRLTKG